MKNKRKMSIISIMIIFIMLFTACTGTTTDEEKPKQDEEKVAEQPKDTIVCAFWNTPSGVLNPVLVDDEYDGAILDLTFDTLFDYDKNYDLVPALAEKYEMSADEKTLTFFLRKDVKWHDGEPFTAKDVEFTFTSMADAEYTGPRAGDVEVVKGSKAYHDGKADKVEGIKVINDYEISIEFEMPFAPALTKLGADRGIIAKHIWEKVPVADWAKQGDMLNNPIGTGPYKLAKFETGQYIELKAFEDYYKGKAKTENFIFKISNQDTTLAELINGEIDIADVSSLKNKDLETLKQNGIKVTSYPGKTCQYMGMNLREAKFQDKRVRQAITYAIDRTLMVEKLAEGNAEIINTQLLPNGWAYPQGDVLNKYPVNIEKAKSLLKEAGWEDKNGNGIVENASGEEFKVVLKYPMGNKTREQSAPIIQASLKQIGIEVELMNLEFATLLDQVMANHEFDLYLMGSSLDLDPDPKPIWHSNAASDDIGNAGWNIVGFRNEKADKLMEAGLMTTDKAERQKIYEEFGILLNDEAPEVYLYAPNIIKAYNGKLKNFEPTTFLDYYNVNEWVIE